MAFYSITDGLRATASDVSTPGNISITDGIGGSVTVSPSQDTATYTLTLPPTNGSSSDVLTSEDTTGSMAWLPPPSFPTFNVWYFKDVKPSGTNGGSASTIAWLQRTLNTTSKPPGTGTEASLSGNSILLEQGVWWIEVYTPFSGTLNQTTTRIIETVSQNVLAYGGIPTNNSRLANIASIEALITVDSGPLSIDIEYQISESVINNLGIACGFGEPETYTLVKVTLVG
jgi:hypothetical protein